jgi:hypothetical protein
LKVAGLKQALNSGRNFLETRHDDPSPSRSPFRVVALAEVFGIHSTITGKWDLQRFG